MGSTRAGRTVLFSCFMPWLKRYRDTDNRGSMKGMGPATLALADLRQSERREEVMMKKEELCERYLAALNRSDLEGVLSLFAPTAEVISPLYGKVEAKEFFKGLFADTNRSETSLLNIFQPVGAGNSVALHFHYRWTLKDGKVVEFEVVDVLEIDESSERFRKLKIIYDTAPIRADFDASRAIIGASVAPSIGKADGATPS